MQSLAPHSCPGWRTWGTSVASGGDALVFSLKFPVLRRQVATRSRRLLISSRLGRQPKRRNSLREKLLTRRDQVRRILDVVTPELQSGVAEPELSRRDDERTGELNMSHSDDRSLREGSRKQEDEEGVVINQKSERKSKLTGEPELWNKLESWVDQYKKDSEIWGVGSAPIFTIYKDCGGNVARVSLDEDEIIRRSQRETLSLQPKKMKEDLNAKVSQAKRIAKEMEAGLYRLPKNSTIAKTVVEGTNSHSSVSRLHLLHPGGKALTAISPRFVLPFIFSIFLAWSLKKFLFTKVRTQITREEKEMLRRKLQSRMERGTTEQDTVEIVRNVPELPGGSEKRPSLDKNELLKNIRGEASSDSKLNSVYELEQEDQRHGESGSLFLPSTADNQIPESMDHPEIGAVFTLKSEQLHTEEKTREGKNEDDKEKPKGMKPKVLVSLSEARDYLAKMHSSSSLSTDRGINTITESMILDHTQDRADSIFSTAAVSSSVGNEVMEAETPNHHHEEQVRGSEQIRSDSGAEFPRKHQSDDDHHTETKQVQDEESWIEKNFEQFDPIIKKIGAGFQENYLSAREKAKEQKAPLAEMGFIGGDEEFEWMNDENLKEIVFKVRDNELAGREPFHLMEPEEKDAFFAGLERKAEKANNSMLALHEFLHSKIENIDYGLDGISVHDPLEKIVPRWKGPPLAEDPEFLNNFAREDVEGRLYPLPPSSPAHDLTKVSSDRASVSPKTIIESSDGSSRPGRRSGKEHWAHTKRWSREFLELYNAETDPEMKSTMRDMGKDLDRWITEKEIKDAADLIARIPRRKRRFIEKKMNKLKTEIENFGHQAVISKYKEYVDEKEEDYLWWMDLSFILCIELYRVEEDVPKIGFYSLEMAADLDLDPKQYHVIAFEDPGDSKNFCHIMQAHLEMLGNGSAFVVARPPKDAFREAKSDGFNVTVIRKGQIELNVDQTLEEVEEEMIEIGSKMYHDTIMRERGVDMGTLMKGIINADKSHNR